MPSQASFRLIAGHVALDFANTLDNRFDADRTVELLEHYDDLLQFCQQSGVVGFAVISHLGRTSKRDQNSALRSAHELREIIERIFSASARTETVDPANLSALNDFVRCALSHRKVVQHRQRFSWAWSDLSQHATALLWPIALAAADLLVSDELGLVRECKVETCRWLFLDSSKNHSRRWCDMKICGNRTKAQRYYRAHS